MEQYFAIKAQHPDTILLFQVGDFYELFFDDAKVVAAFLAITLTKRGRMNGQDIPLCGIPVHTLQHYLTKLIKGGFTIALCNQLSKPQPGTVVERAVTQVFTPGTLTDSMMLDEKSASYLLTLYPTNDCWGVLFTELLTAQMFATTIKTDQRSLHAELIRFFPDEIILPKNMLGEQIRRSISGQGYYTHLMPYQEKPTSLEEETLMDLQEQWSQEKLSCATRDQLAHIPALSHSVSMLYRYLKRTHEQALSQLSTINFYEADDFLILDHATQKNLEIIVNSHDGGRSHTLFAVMDQASTPMGSRTIKKWLQRPLVHQSSITARHDVIATLSPRYDLMLRLQELFKSLGDLERIIGRIALNRAHLNDYRQLTSSLGILSPLVDALAGSTNTSLIGLLSTKLSGFEPLYQLLCHSINTDYSKEWTIKPGFDQQLDHYRSLIDHSDDAIKQLEQEEIARTGIPSLKINSNNQQGFYIEVTHTHKHKIPEHYIHQQTLINRSRYRTEQLLTLESALATAAEQAQEQEILLFEQVQRQVQQYLGKLRHCAHALAQLDALLSLSLLAYHHQYVRPRFGNDGYLAITAGRHPVVEQHSQTPFVPNDTLLSDEQSLLIITGPNMGGKSTYLRQVALINIMAQCGSFVPASSATLPIIDRIFTRIGSGDNVAQGKSTFLVEMEETAVICTQATSRSLVILDEVGRGTSTNDGIALAHAIIEYLHHQIQARCLFATHYHELTHLANQYPGIANYHLRCQRHNNELYFLHEIQKGAAHASFGLDVARQAHVPLSIIKRAQELLNQYDGNQPVLFAPATTTLTAPLTLQHHQQNVSPALDPVYQQLESVDPDDLTPRQALDLVIALKKSMRPHS